MPRKKAVVEELNPKVFMKMVNDRFGAGTMKMGSDPSFVIQRLPSGILSVDYALNGGFARGRHVELYGSANVGKSALAYRTMATTQTNGGRVAYVNAEKTFDPEFAEHLGCDNDELVLHDQINANRVVDFTETLLRSRLYDVITIDSISALTPKIEIESDMETTGSMGMEQAKLMSKALRKLTTANDKTLIIWINQTRDSVGGMFAKKTTTSGGRAMGFYAATRIEMVRTETIKKKSKVINSKNLRETEGDVAIGHRVLLRIEKDKTGSAKPYDQTSFVFSYELSDIDPVEDLIYVGRVAGLVHTQGSERSQKWWIEGYEEDKVTGKNRFAKYLRQNKAIAEELEEQIWSTLSEEEDE